MTSSYKQLLQDFIVGRNGEDIVQKFFYDEFGIVTQNVGERKLGWDLEVTDIDGSKLKLTDITYKEDYFLDKFKKQFGKTFEVKRDVTSDKSGNLYWECWSNARLNNPGCMLTCVADTVVFVRKSELLFFSRAKLLSWIFDNLFVGSAESEVWRQKTTRGGKNQMMAARNNPDVRGILIPIEHLKNSPACFHTEKR